jgi:hypothetical protein
MRESKACIWQQRPQPLKLRLAQPKLAQRNAPATAERVSHPERLCEICLWVRSLTPALTGHRRRRYSPLVRAPKLDFVARSPFNVERVADPAAPPVTLHE